MEDRLVPANPNLLLLYNGKLLNRAALAYSRTSLQSQAGRKA
jgi:hypothetical protein